CRIPDQRRRWRRGFQGRRVPKECRRMPAASGAGTQSARQGTLAQDRRALVANGARGRSGTQLVLLREKFCPLPLRERATRWCNIREWVRGSLRKKLFLRRRPLTHRNCCATIEP